MKLIIHNERIVGTATDEYSGPEIFIDAPTDFDAQQMGNYTVSDGVASLPVVNPFLAFEAALDRHLDATAQARRYDNRITCALRAGYPGPFQPEGQAFALWMDACNLAAYTLLAEVQAGTRPLPENAQALIEALPPMVWPE